MNPAGQEAIAAGSNARRPPSPPPASGGFSDSFAIFELSASQVSRIRRALEWFRRESSVELVALLNDAGMVVAAAGPEETSLEDGTVGALASGAFAALRCLAERIGEPGFEACFQHGRHRHLHLCDAGSGCVLFSVYADGVSPGMLGLCAERVKLDLRDVLPPQETAV